MLFFLISLLFFENSAQNISSMPAPVFKKCLNLRKNFYSRQPPSDPEMGLFLFL